MVTDRGPQIGFFDGALTFRIGTDRRLDLNGAVTHTDARVGREQGPHSDAGPAENGGGDGRDIRTTSYNEAHVL